MAGCSCCECSWVANYRGWRIRPENISFADWCNSERGLFDLEDTVFLDSVGGEDAGGPFRITTSGTWVTFGAYISSGSLTLHGVYGSAFSLIVAGETSCSLDAWGETVAVAPDVWTGTEDKYGCTLSIGDEEIATAPKRSSPLPGCILTIYKWSDTGLPSDIGNAGLFTATTPSVWDASPNVPTGEITHPFTLTPTVASPVANYYNAPVQLEGAGVKLYRDGELVWEATRPEKTESEAHTEEDGVYLFVSEHDEDYDPPYIGAGLDHRSRTLSPLKKMRSFVIDSDLPVIGATVPRDWFVDEGQFVFGADAIPLPGIGRVTSTKPLSYLAATLTTEDTVASPRAVRPIGLSLAARWLSGVTPVSQLQAGTHAITLKSFDNLTWVPVHEAARDYAGNYPASSPQVTVTVHAVPANNRRGARPHLEDVGLQTREFWRARYQHEAITSVRLTFDRKVKPDTVSDSQLMLTKDGEDVPGCTLSQVSDTEWTVTLPPEAEQSPKSFWILTYDPAGEVLTDDVDEIEYRSFNDFPPVSQTIPYRAYKAKDTGKRYCGAVNQYVEIGEGPPVDVNGVPYEPEPCLLATRTSWLMASDWLVPLDTTVGDTVVIGDTMSVSKTVDEWPGDEGTFAFTMTGDAAINNWGNTRSGMYADGFVPQAPPQSDPPDDCSYFGLTTTIDPCPPKTLRCPSPRIAQRHASVVRSDDDIATLSGKIYLTDADGSDPAALSAVPLDAKIREVIGMTRTFDSVRDDKQLQQNTWFTKIDEELYSPAQETDSGFSGLQLAFAKVQFNNAIFNQFGDGLFALYGTLYENTDTGEKFSKAPGGKVASNTPLDKDGNAFGEVGVIGGEVWIHAYRNATTYPGMMTAILSELAVRVRGYILFQAINTNLGEIVEYRWSFASSANADLAVALSKQQEEQLADGGVVELPLDGVASVKNGSEVWWLELQSA